MTLKRSDLCRDSAVRGQMHDPQFEQRYPYLYGHLTQVRWEDGSPRTLSSLGIYPDGGIIRVVVRDPNSGLMCWVAVDRLSALWEVIEAALSDPGHEWRVDRQKPGQTAKRVQAPEPPTNSVDKRRPKR